MKQRSHRSSDTTISLHAVPQSHSPKEMVPPSTEQPQMALQPSPISASASDNTEIAQKIIQRGELAKMTRQLKEKLLRAGLRVKDQHAPHTAGSISDSISNDISNTAMQNISTANARRTPVRPQTAATTVSSSPLKRRTGSFSELDSSPTKKQMMLNSSPLFSNTSPYSNRSLMNTPLSIQQQQHNIVPFSKTPSHSSATNMADSRATLQPPSTPPPTFASVAAAAAEAANSKLSASTLSDHQHQHLQQLSQEQPQQQGGQSHDNVPSTPKTKLSNPSHNDVGADLLLYLLKSPANNTPGRPTVPTTPKLSSSSTHHDLSVNIFADHAHHSQTGQPPQVAQHPSISVHAALPGVTFSPSLMANGDRCPQTPTTAATSNLLSTPLAKFQTPMTPNRLRGTPGFILTDFINFSPNVQRTPDLAHMAKMNSHLGEDTT